MSDVPITVDCQISAQKFGFDYELDNTLEVFLNDLQDQQPPMGFSNKKPTTNEGVLIDGTAYVYETHRDATLLSLGAKTNSHITLAEYLSVCGPSPQSVTSTGLRGKRPSSKLSNKKPRKQLQMKPHKGLKTVDIDGLSGFQCVKIAALNGWNERLNSISAHQRIDELKAWLHMRRSRGSVRTLIPDQFKDKTVETPIGELPYENFVLWCTGTSTLPNGALHTLLNAESLAESNPGDEIIQIIGAKCSVSGCGGIIRLWDYKSTPPK